MHDPIEVRIPMGDIGESRTDCNMSNGYEKKHAGVIGRSNDLPDVDGCYFSQIGCTVGVFSLGYPLNFDQLNLMIVMWIL